MDPNNQPNTTPINAAPSSPTPPSNSMPTNEHKKVGPIIATLIIVLVLIIAALYLFASRMNQQQTPLENSAATMPYSQNAPVVQTSIQPITGSADDTVSLTNDLNASTNGLDSQNF